MTSNKEEATPTLKETSPASAATTRFNLRSPKLWVLIALIIGVAAGAQLIGPLVIPLGAAAVTLLPMIWGLIAGAVASGQKLKPIPADLQQAAGVVMGIAVLVLCARLSFTIGPNIPLLLQAGPALLLQEVGHLFGTIALALPLATLLRMGPATIGASFSIDRESSFAMVGERYGSDTPQYRGVLSMYVFGTIFGAVIVSLVASLCVSMGIFDPIALAMGSGVGSGSMMAAAAAVIVAGHPDMQEQVLAVAAASNLITSVLGLYIGVWVSLPLADKFYKLLTRKRTADQPAAEKLHGQELATIRANSSALLKTPTATVNTWTSLAIISAAGLPVSCIAAKGFRWDMIITYLMLSLLTVLGLAVAQSTKGKLPAIIVVITAGALATSPVSPIAPWVVHTSTSVEFLSLITVMLTIGGLSLGKDLPMLKSIGWKIIPVGTVAITASFLLATIIAEFALGLWR